MNFDSTRSIILLFLVSLPFALLGEYDLATGIMMIWPAQRLVKKVYG